MRALVALQSSPHVKAFYEGKAMNGKPKKKVIVAVMRKLLHAIWGLLRSEADRDGQRFHALATACAAAPGSAGDAQEVKAEVASSTAASPDTAPACQRSEPPASLSSPIAYPAPSQCTAGAAPAVGSATASQVIFAAAC